MANRLVALMRSIGYGLLILIPQTLPLGRFSSPIEMNFFNRWIANFNARLLSHHCMSYEQNKVTARKFIHELFNEGKVDEANNFVTSDIIYHGLEELRGLENLKKWIIEDRKAFPDMQVTIVEEIADANTVAVRWTLNATHEGDFAGLAASHKKFEAHGADIFHFENNRIKEAWTIFDALAPALKLGIVEMKQPGQSNK